MAGDCGVEGEVKMSASGRRALPALVIAVTLGIGILIGTVVSHGVRAAKGFAGGRRQAAPHALSR